MKLFKFFILFISTISYSLQYVNAAGLTVDKMFIISDHNKNGIVTIANTSNSPIFVDASIDEFHMNDTGDDFIKKRYNNENFENWKISTTLSKIILQSGEARNIGIRSLCYNTSCDDSKDLMFFVTFMPSPYIEEGEEEAGSDAMFINYGFSPAYIIPTDNPEIDYEIKYVNDAMVVENKSNTMIYVSIDNCDNKINLENCFSRSIIVSGRTKSFKLNKNVLDKPLKINVSTYNGAYTKDTVLQPLGIFKDVL